MNWNELYNQIAEIKNKAIKEIQNNLPKIKEHPSYDKTTDYLPMEEMEMLVDGEMSYVNGISPNGMLSIAGEEPTDIYNLDVYDLVYLGEQLELTLNGDKE